MLVFNEKNVAICDALEKLPICKENWPLYFEILKSSTSPLIWGGFADLLKKPCRSNKEFITIVSDLLEDNKTIGARGYLLNALAFFSFFSEREVDIVFNEILTGNLECRNKALSILSIIYNSSSKSIKQYVEFKIANVLEKEERCLLRKRLKFNKQNYYYDEIEIRNDIALGASLKNGHKSPNGSNLSEI